MICEKKGKVIQMSNCNRTPEEYIQRYARDYCNGDTEAAKSHAIVREAEKTLEKE